MQLKTIVAPPAVGSRHEKSPCICSSVAWMQATHAGRHPLPEEIRNAAHGPCSSGNLMMGHICSKRQQDGSLCLRTVDM